MGAVAVAVVGVHMGVVVAIVVVFAVVGSGAMVVAVQ